MRVKLQQKSKFFIYFLIGIALPCLLLGYFAFRGIQNDRAWYEQQVLNKNQRIAQRIINNVYNYIHSIENSYLLSGIIDSIKIENLPHKIDSIKNQYPLIETFFSFHESSGKVYLIGSRLLFTMEYQAEKHPASTNMSQLPAYLHGLRNEFQERSYQRAIENYSQAFVQAEDITVKGEILTAIARVQKKASLYRDAIKSYQSLSENYHDVQISNGIPLALAAQNELGFIYATLRDTLAAIQTYLNCYNNLYRGFWVLDKSRYQFWSLTLKDSLNKIFSRIRLIPPYLSYFNKFQSIQQQESQQEHLTLRLFKFQSKAESFIRRKIALEPGRSAYQFTIVLEDQRYFVSLLARPFNEIPEYAGILWRADVIRDSLLSFLRAENLVENRIAWKLINEENQVILPTENITTSDKKLMVKTSFVNNFPDWTLEFYYQNPNLMKSLLTSRQSIYLYIFLLIAGILAFGLIFTIKSVTHELDLVRMKSDFVSSVSHELKSPLTSIRQLAEMLQTGRVPSEQHRQKYYQVIVEQSKRLSLMISNVLDFARMEDGKKQYNPELTEIDSFLTEMVTSIQQQISYDGFEVKLTLGPELPAIWMDRSAIAQAINNLIDNAIKYSERITKVEVKSFVAAQFLWISVTDFGIGIRKEEVDKIFDRFYRGNDASVRAQRGSGLGLTLVKQIVQGHRGSVQVDSELGKGSTFTIKLPI